MKTHITLLAIAAVTINTAWIAPASSPVNLQDKQANVVTAVEPGFSFFRVHRQGKNGVTATWGLSSSDGVSGFSVEKTYEDPNDEYAYWETVSAMPCTGERSYKCTDAGVYPGTITYRVTAFLNDGRAVLSEMASIQINGR
jgi:hypothetical protein